MTRSLPPGPHAREDRLRRPPLGRVDHGSRLLWIPDSKTEAGSRQIRVPVQLVPHLQRLAAGKLPAAPLFAHVATRARAQARAREQVTRLCKLAGVPRVTPHGLRRTLATMGRKTGKHVAGRRSARARKPGDHRARLHRQRAGAGRRSPGGAAGARWRAALNELGAERARERRGNANRLSCFHGPPQRVDLCFLNDSACEWPDSNRHGVTHWYLKPARLPIPPHSRTEPGLGGPY
jgi:hypothetical protein